MINACLITFRGRLQGGVAELASLYWVWGGRGGGGVQTPAAERVAAYRAADGGAEGCSESRTDLEVAGIQLALDKTQRQDRPGTPSSSGVCSLS